MEKIIYVDHSATTAVKKEVIDEMLPYFNLKYGNASSQYSIGRLSKDAIENSRKKVAKAIGVKSEEIYFTSGGSEADNMIISGIARANKSKGNHIITSKIEHLAVLNTCKMLEREGFELTYLNVNKDGIVDLEELKNSIKDNTILISIMYANNEIGTIQPIKQIGQIAKERNVLFHTDAVQAIGNIKIDAVNENIDALSLSAHKFYGPKGIGAAYIKEGINFEPLINGGHQESLKRAGTENVPSIVGLGKAIELANNNIVAYNKHLLFLRENLISLLEQNIRYIGINGHRTQRLPGNVNLSIRGIDGESLLLLLDMNGICASNGSACTSGSQTPSHVLKAIGLSDCNSQGTIRISFGEENTISDVRYISNTLIKIVEKLRCN